MTVPRRKLTPGTFHDLRIQFKASLASALLLPCLLALGVNAYLTSTRSAAGLDILSNDLSGKQQAFSDIGTALSTIHFKIFRYVSWASNGVSVKLLAPLNTEILRDLDTLSGRVETLAKRTDFSSGEQRALRQIAGKWKGGSSQAKDTLDIGQTDAPMATMMMGQTDDIFNEVHVDIQKLSVAINNAADGLRNQLALDAERNKQVILVVAVIGFLINRRVPGGFRSQGSYRCLNCGPWCARCCRCSSLNHQLHWVAVHGTSVVARSGAGGAAIRVGRRRSHGRAVGIIHVVRAVSRKSQHGRSRQGNCGCHQARLFVSIIKGPLTCRSNTSPSLIGPLHSPMAESARLMPVTAWRHRSGQGVMGLFER